MAESPLYPDKPAPYNPHYHTNGHLPPPRKDLPAPAPRVEEVEQPQEDVPQWAGPTEGPTGTP